MCGIIDSHNSHSINSFFSKPKFLDSHVKRIEEGWEDTKQKATTRLQLLQKTKDAWIGYAEGLETIAVEFEKAEEEMKKVKKRFALASAMEDLEKRQAIFNECKSTIEGMYKALQDNYDCRTDKVCQYSQYFIHSFVLPISCSKKRSASP